MYQALLLIKFASVLAFAGGAMSAVLSDAPATRHRAVHWVASPALLGVWASGYGLANLLGISYAEMWLTGGLVLSLFAQVAMTQAVRHAWSSKVTAAWVLTPLALTLVLMVYRPTWSSL